MLVQLYQAFEQAMGILCFILEIPSQKQIVLNSLLFLINADDVVSWATTATRATLVSAISTRSTTSACAWLAGPRVYVQIIDLLFYFLDQPI